MSIGYFEHSDHGDKDFLWLTPWQYLQWRRKRYGRQYVQAKAEFEWLRDKHTLISMHEDGEHLFFICVHDIEHFHLRDSSVSCVSSQFPPGSG